MSQQERKERMEQRNIEEKVTKTSKFHEKYKFTDLKSLVTPNKLNGKKDTPMYIINKLLMKRKILKAGRGKWRTLSTGELIPILVDFPSEAMKARREKNNTFKVLEGRKIVPVRPETYIR